MTKLTHLDHDGKASMVDVSAKAVTHRKAVAKGIVTMAPETLALIMDGGIPKGDVLAAARIAGIMAAKKTPELIPLCHSLALDNVAVDLRCNSVTSAVEIEAAAIVTGRTGVEMEAMTAVCVAGLTIYDMCKAVDRKMVIGDVRLTYKSGGKSGVFEAD